MRALAVARVTPRAAANEFTGARPLVRRAAISRRSMSSSARISEMYISGSNYVQWASKSCNKLLLFERYACLYAERRSHTKE